MRDRTPGIGLRSVLTVATAILLTTTTGIHAQRGPAEVRALWVVRSTLSSPASIATMVGAAKDGGFNTLIVPVAARAGASAASTPVGLGSESAFDPINEVIERAHEAGLRVHAWIDVTRVASAVELPLSRDHDVSRHPEWLMVPRALAEDLLKVDPKSPEFLGRLARYARNPSSFAAEVASVREIAGEHPTWAGIGASALSESDIVATVQAARRLGAGGVILFSYDGLTGPSRGTEYLSQVGRAAFMQ